MRLKNWLFKQITIASFRNIRINQSLFFFSRLLFTEDFKNYIQYKRVLPKIESNEVVLLANGPSLKEVLTHIKNKSQEFQNKDFLFVNYLAQESIFEEIKPKYYCITDPQFFLDDQPKSEMGHKLVEYIKEHTTWDMNIFVLYMYWDKLKFIEENTHIKVIPIHSPKVEGLVPLVKMAYKRGLGNGEFGTVIQNAIYAMILLNYKKIHLYGVDHNFFDNLCLDDNNVLCSRVTHFYDKDKPELRPVKITKDNLKTYEFLDYYAYLFKGYFILKDFATEMNCEIINHTKNSLIDAFRKE